MNNLYKYCGASGFQKEEILKIQFWLYVISQGIRNYYNWPGLVELLPLKFDIKI